MNHGASLLAFLLGVTPCMIAQQQKRPAMVAEDGELQERGSARVLYWDTAGDKAFGQFAIDYGRPVWKSAYDDAAKFDAATKGKVYRLGSNWWTSLDTHVPLKISGKEVAAGYYFLGLERSQDGAAWSLVFIDPVRVRAARLDAFQIERAPILFKIPMTAEQAPAPTEKLTITLTYPKENPKKVEMAIAWGRLRLTAPVLVTVGP